MSEWYPLSFKTPCVVIIKTMASTWRGNMRGHLSLDIICSSQFSPSHALGNWQYFCVKWRLLFFLSPQGGGIQWGVTWKLWYCIFWCSERKPNIFSPQSKKKNTVTPKRSRHSRRGVVFRIVSFSSRIRSHLLQECRVSFWTHISYPVTRDFRRVGLRANLEKNVKFYRSTAKFQQWQAFHS